MASGLAAVSYTHLDVYKRQVHRMENAIANHEFEKARFYSDEERKERENMRQLREKYNLDDSSTGCVTKDDIEDVVARWTGVPMTSIKEEEIAKLLRIEDELHKRIVRDVYKRQLWREWQPRSCPILR